MNPARRVVYGICAVILLCLGACTPVFCFPPLPKCTDEDLRDLRYEGSAVAGDADRVVFERAGHVKSYCSLPRDLSIAAPPPYERIWVRVDLPDLTLTVMPLPRVPTYEIATDGYWAAISDSTRDAIVLRDLDAGTERVLVESINDPYRYVLDVARPYVILHHSNDGLGVLLNAETGTSRQITTALGTAALKPPFLAYSEYIHPSGNDYPLPERLRRLNLDTGQETLIAEPRRGVSRLKLFEARAVWMEYRNNYRSNTVVVHDFASGETADLTTVEWGGFMLPSTWVDDMGEAGVVIRREHVDETNDSVTETIELLSYDGQTRLIETGLPPANFNETSRCIGPYVVYPRGGRWIIYNPADDTRVDLDPFAQIPPSQ